MRLFIRDGGGRGVKVDCRHQPRRPRMLWTATRTTKMLRQCPLGIVQQLVYHAVTVSTVVQNRVGKTMSIALLLRNK